MDISLTNFRGTRRSAPLSSSRGCGVGRLLQLLRDAGARRARHARGTLQRTQGRHRQGTGDREEAAAVSRRRSNELEERLANLSAVLPEEKDAADLLRQHADGRRAVQPGDQELQAGAGRHQGDARRVADQPRAGRHVPQPRACSSTGSASSRASSTSARCGQGQGQGRPARHNSASCVATTFVLLDKPAKKNSKGTPDNKAGSEKPAAPKKVA